MQVDQILPSVSYGDAVSNDALNIRDVLRKNGYKSEIYAKHIHSDLARNVRPFESYKSDSRGILLYHFSLAGGDVTRFVMGKAERTALIYHNITPPEFFRDYDLTLYELCLQGLNELRDLGRCIRWGIGVSEYNRQMLEMNGFEMTAVLPILIDWDALDIARGMEIPGSGDGAVNILFVGRLAPNKKFEDLIQTFYYYHLIQPNSKLYLVGSEQIQGYVSYLKYLVTALKLENHVIFTGLVDKKQLAACYRSADLFLCMSEHEGFCVPLLEAMYYGIPIIAYKSTGVPYTLGDSGILITKKDYSQIAELIHIVIEDSDLREKIVTKQRDRMNDFNYEKISSDLISLIQRVSAEVHP